MQCHLVSIVTEVSVDNWECIYPGLKGWGRRNNLAGCYSDRISPNFWDKGQNRIFICLVDSDTYMILTSKVHYRCLWSVCSIGEKTEKAMAPHSSTLAWNISWMEEPGRLQSMGSWGSDTTEQLPFHFSLWCIGEGNGNPLQCSCLENLRGGGAWWAAVYGVSQSRTRLKWLSSSSSSACSVMSDSLQPHGLYPFSPLCLRDFPGKNTGVGCHVLLQGIFLTWGSKVHLLCLLCKMQVDILLLMPPGEPTDIKCLWLNKRMHLSPATGSVKSVYPS